MGQEPSKPVPGTKFKVIGAGLSRTGTASFAAALSILLDGPVFHGGTQLGSSPSDLKKMVKLFQQSSTTNPAGHQAILKTLRDVYDGYAAATDNPAGQFVSELLEIYPDAVVICTVRDPDSWARSIQDMVGQTVTWGYRLFLLPLPGIRHFPAFLDALAKGRWGELYSRGSEPKLFYGRAMYDRHIEYLKRVVPKEKLVFYDLRDGWGPLCDALGVEIPKGVEFPRINDAKAMEKTAKMHVARALKTWAVIIGTGAVWGWVGYKTLRG